MGKRLEIFGDVRIIDETNGLANDTLFFLPNISKDHNQDNI